MPDEKPACSTCAGDGRILFMWPRMGGPPGNGWGGCPDCKAGRDYDAALKAETDACLRDSWFNGVDLDAIEQAFAETKPGMSGPFDECLDISEAMARAREDKD